MKWIKASERLPKNPGRYFVKVGRQSIPDNGDKNQVATFTSHKEWYLENHHHSRDFYYICPVEWLDESVKDQMGYELSLMLYRAIKRLGKKELFEDDHKFIDEANEIIAKYSNPLDALRSESKSPLPDEQGDAISDHAVLINQLNGLCREYLDTIEKYKEFSNNAYANMNAKAADMWNHKRDGLIKAERDIRILVSRYNSPSQPGSQEGEATCVFCKMPCEPAPTNRGWSSVRYGKGLHFDCAGKVVDQGNIIGMKELEDFGKDPTI